MRFSVEERAGRFQRRYTGPWQTRQLKLNITLHDLQCELLIRPFRAVNRWLARHGL